MMFSREIVSTRFLRNLLYFWRPTPPSTSRQMKATTAATLATTATHLGSPAPRLPTCSSVVVAGKRSSSSLLLPSLSLPGSSRLVVTSIWRGSAVVVVTAVGGSSIEVSGRLVVFTVCETKWYMYHEPREKRTLINVKKKLTRITRVRMRR